MDLSQFPLVPPRYNFRASLLCGTTPAAEGGLYDYYIDRPSGMKGYVMHLTLEGEGEVINKGQHFVCRPGDLLLFPPGVSHYYGRKDSSRIWVHQWVFFHPRSYWRDMLEWNTVCAGIGYFRPEEINLSKYEQLFSTLISAGKSQLAHKQLLALNFLEQIILRRIDELNTECGVTMDERISTVCNFINANLTESAKCSIDNIARHINLSRSRTLHLFREKMGTSIFQWRDDQRMIMAKRLLSETMLPVSVVADKVGFEDQLYFSKVFKKYTGSSPTKYRIESHGK